jgi:threonyl-tRNA synthetase
MLAEAEKRDHRRLGRELDLFHLQDDAPGMVFWHPRGFAVWQQVEQYMRRIYQDNGYQEIRCPQVLDRSLWERSGHWENYKDAMFTTASENRDYAVKPMNCPGHVQVYNAGLRSYRDLPLRYGEFGACHRNEPSGALHGIMRVRGFVQDDGHIFCTEDQIQQECANYTRLLQSVYADFGFDQIIYKLATRPVKRTLGQSRSRTCKLSYCFRCYLYGERRRWRLLRSEDRVLTERRAWTYLAVRHDAGRFQYADSLGCRVC